MRYLTLLTVLTLVAACSIRAPELDASITDQSRAADWPELVPLGPILTRTELAGPPRAEAWNGAPPICAAAPRSCAGCR